jgi:predicted N-acetyltransferase YhbS
LFVQKACVLAKIVSLSQIDPVAIEALLDAAFGADRHKRTAYQIRLGMTWLPDLSFAALAADGALLGTLQSWPVALHTPDRGAHSLTLVGPVAVDPTAQRTGIGRLMMAALMTATRAGAQGTDAMVMIGDPEYYERFFGFSAAATGGWDVPGPVERHRLLARIARVGGLPKIGLLGPRNPIN